MSLGSATIRPPPPHAIPLLNALRGLKPKSNGGYMGFCPGHNDQHKRSLSIDFADDKVLVRCFVGCTVESIMAAVGLDMQTLFEDDPFAQRPPAQPQAHQPVVQRHPDAIITYKVLDATGATIASHVRLETGGKKTFYWERNGKQGLGDLKLASLPLYGSWALPPALDYLLCVEGEKAQVSLQERGYPAVGTYGASVIPDKLQLAFPCGVFLWPDADKPGAEHMNAIANILTHELNNPPLIVHWPDAPPHGDAADYTGDVDELLGGAKLWEESHINTRPDGQTTGIRGLWSGA